MLASVHARIVAASQTSPSPGWAHYWAIWFTLVVTGFLVPEIWALCTRWQNTLSAWVWSLEKFQAGQPITAWSAFHFLFIGVLLLMDVWLLGHFAFGLWRD